MLAQPKRPTNGRLECPSSFLKVDVRSSGSFRDIWRVDQLLAGLFTTPKRTLGKPKAVPHPADDPQRDLTVARVSPGGALPRRRHDFEEIYSVFESEVECTFTGADG